VRRSTIDQGTIVTNAKARRIIRPNRRISETSIAAAESSRSDAVAVALHTRCSIVLDINETYLRII